VILEFISEVDVESCVSLCLDFSISCLSDSILFLSVAIETLRFSTVL